MSRQTIIESFMVAPSAAESMAIAVRLWQEEQRARDEAEAWVFLQRLRRAFHSKRSWLAGWRLPWLDRRIDP